MGRPSSGMGGPQAGGQEVHRRLAGSSVGCLCWAVAHRGGCPPTIHRSYGLTKPFTHRDYGSEQQFNFQRASCGLDAGVNIYSKRVDSVFETCMGIGFNCKGIKADVGGGSGAHQGGQSALWVTGPCGDPPSCSPCLTPPLTRCR